MVHTCDPSIQETEAGRSQVQGQFRLQSKSQKVNQTTTKGERRKKSQLPLHVYNPRIWEGEAGTRSSTSWSTLATKPGLYIDFFSQFFVCLFFFFFLEFLNSRFAA